MALVERTDAVKDYLYFSRVLSLIKEPWWRRYGGTGLWTGCRGSYLVLPPTALRFLRLRPPGQQPENHDRGPRECELAAQLVDHVHLAHVAARSDIFQIGLEMQSQSIVAL